MERNYITISKARGKMRHIYAASYMASIQHYLSDSADQQSCSYTSMCCHVCVAGIINTTTSHHCCKYHNLKRKMCTPSYSVNSYVASCE